MKGTVVSTKGSTPGRYPQNSVIGRVASARHIQGGNTKFSSTKTSIAGGFVASRKKGSVRGSC